MFLHSKKEFIMRKMCKPAMFFGLCGFGLICGLTLAADFIPNALCTGTNCNTLSQVFGPPINDTCVFNNNLNGNFCVTPGDGCTTNKALFGTKTCTGTWKKAGGACSVPLDQCN